MILRYAVTDETGAVRFTNELFAESIPATTLRDIAARIAAPHPSWTLHEIGPSSPMPESHSWKTGTWKRGEIVDPSIVATRSMATMDPRWARPPDAA